MDKATLERIAKAHPKIRTELNSMYEEICQVVSGKSMCRFAYVTRTWEEQNELYALGRTKPGKKVTWAKGGESYHNYALAFDIVLIIDKDGNGTYETASWDDKIDLDGDGTPEWIEIVHIAKKYGWEWGGDWNSPKTDKPHFQKSFGYSVMELKSAMAAGKTTNGYVNI